MQQNIPRITPTPRPVSGRPPRWSAHWSGLLAGLLVLVAGGATFAACDPKGNPAFVRIEALSGIERGAAPGAAAAAPPAPRSFFATQQVVAYYGNPLSSTMGVLGEYQGDELIQRVKAQAAKYQALNPDKSVVAALHLVYAVAQARPGPEGTYLNHMPDEMVEQFIELTRANNMLFFIDLQNGRADPVAEAAQVQSWLRNEHVHLAIDPEFTYAPGETPQEDIGEIDGATINQIQDLLQQTALDARVGNKILVVHQFRPDMITNKMTIAKRERVDVVIDMDGWGGKEAKLSKYQAHITNEPLQFAGIKLFYRWDAPMLSEAEVQALSPRPAYVQYQ